MVKIRYLPLKTPKIQYSYSIHVTLEFLKYAYSMQNLILHNFCNYTTMGFLLTKVPKFRNSKMNHPPSASPIIYI